MIRVLRVAADAEVTAHDVADAQAVQPQHFASYVGGLPDQAVYHPRALLRVHGRGHTLGLPANLTAWAFACAWRGLHLPYLLHGPVIITGRDSGGGVAALDAQLGAPVHATAQIVRETLAQWRQRPPSRTRLP
jgi:hypothetical protein